jgi:AcrR family transcriptional regulator
MRPQTRAEAKEETRDALIDAGMWLFSREGLDGPSLDAICARAGYTRGAFYVHFKDRDDFIAAVMNKVGRKYLDAVLSTTEGDLSTVMSRFVRTLADGSYPLTQVSGVKPRQLLEACARSKVVRRRYQALVGETLERVEMLAADGQRQRVVRRDVDPRQVSAILLAAVIGAQTMIELEIPIDPARAAATLFVMLQGDNP